jgi:hypothetical protein
MVVEEVAHTGNKENAVDDGVGLASVEISSPIPLNEFLAEASGVSEHMESHVRGHLLERHFGKARPRCTTDSPMRRGGGAKGQATSDERARHFSWLLAILEINQRPHTRKRWPW